MLKTLFLASGLVFMLALTACEEGEEPLPTDVPPAAEPTAPPATEPTAEPAQQ